MPLPSWDETTSAPTLVPETSPNLPSWNDTSSEPQTAGGPMEARAQAPAPPSWDQTTEAPTQTVPAEPPKPERPPHPNDVPSDDQVPGYWDVFKSATSRKMTEAAANLAAGTQVLLPKGMGGKTLEEQRADGDIHPATNDYIDKMLSQNLTQGWTNLRWWVAQMGGNVGGVAPGLGAAVGASAVGGPLAGIAAFAGEAAVERIVPAYKAGIAAGLTPDQAATRAGIDSGIAAAFATGMGMVGKFPLTGTVTKEIEGEVATVLRRPILEAMVQLGVVQPGLMAGQDVATTLSHGEAPDAHQILTDMVVGGLGGLAIHETFRGLDKVQELRRKPGEEAKPPSAEEIAAAAEAQRPTPGFARETARRLGVGAEPAAPVAPPGQQEEPGFEALGGYHERDVTPAWVSERPSYFYSAAERAIDAMPEKFQGKDLVNYLKGRGVKDSEINDLDLRGFLKDADGTIKKPDLQAWVEANQVQVWEKTFRDQPPTDAMMEANALYDHNMRTFGPMETWPPRTRRHFDQVNQVARADERERAGAGPQYPGQVVMGLRNNPEEITFRTPVRQFTPEEIDARARADWEESQRYLASTGRGMGVARDWFSVPMKYKERMRFEAERRLREEDPELIVGSHYSDPNTSAHTRITYETDRDGRSAMVIHEVQSDAHQLGAKIGYQEGKPRTPDVVREELKGID